MAPSAQPETHDLRGRLRDARGVMLSFDGAAAWVLWVRDETGPFKKVGRGGRVLKDASAMKAEREALCLGTEKLTDLTRNVILCLSSTLSAWVRHGLGQCGWR